MERMTKSNLTRQVRKSAKAAVTCEKLEDRQLLSHMHAGFGMRQIAARSAHFGSLHHGHQSTLTVATPAATTPAAATPAATTMPAAPATALTAPASTAPADAGGWTGGEGMPGGGFGGVRGGHDHRGGFGGAGPTVPAAVATAQATLQTDLKVAALTGKPSDGALDAVRTDQEAVDPKVGPTAAQQVTLDADHAAVLVSQGATSLQATQIVADQDALQAAIKASLPAGSTSPMTHPSAPAAVTTAQATLRADLGNVTFTGAASSASLTTLMTDSKAVDHRTGPTAAQSATLLADRAAVLASRGLTSAQATTIATDEAAVHAAIDAAIGSTGEPGAMGGGHFGGGRGPAGFSGPRGGFGGGF